MGKCDLMNEFQTELLALVVRKEITYVTCCDNPSFFLVRNLPWPASASLQVTRRSHLSISAAVFGMQEVMLGALPVLLGLKNY